MTSWVLKTVLAERGSKLYFYDKQLVISDKRLRVVTNYNFEEKILHKKIWAPNFVILKKKTVFHAEIFFDRPDLWGELRLAPFSAPSYNDAND